MAEKQNRVAEDVVGYSLFPVIAGEKQGYELKKLLEECVRHYLTYLSPTLIDVIWQNEPFKLMPVEEQGATPAHISGQTNYGDNVEDEWFIVYLLFQLTKQFPGLVTKVWDSDEEFLLVEAASALPKWLNPETAENRVYIYKGQVHIIPVPQSPADVSAFPHIISSIGDAVECIRTYSDQTRASQKIQTAILNRIKHFPDLVQESIHYAHSYIPASLAAILEEHPQLIAAAVRAFYYRDPIDLQCCRTFTYFRPGTRVMHRTRFTRCLYAQMVHQQFQADKRSGWAMPSTSNPKFKSHDLGMKLAHGFEILCHKASDKPVPGGNGDSIPTNDVRWQQYVKSLKDKNYFRGELEGSILYQELTENAWKFYQENITRNGNRPTDTGSEILQLLQTVKFDIEARRRAQDSLEAPDDDSWLTLTPESLDALLKNRSGTGGGENQDDPDGVFDLSKVADSMKTFVDKVSSVDGVEFPPAADDEDADIQFDGSGFISAMQEMFEFEDSGSDSSSDMDEYGWEEDLEGNAEIKRPPSLDKYMDMMDRELAKTEVGKSFEKQTKAKSRGSHKEASPSHTKTPNRDVNDEDDDFQPVDVDMNTVKNLLHSYGAQEGLPGPASNILGSMGITLPPDADSIPEESNNKPTNNGSATTTNQMPKPAPRNKKPIVKDSSSRENTPQPQGRPAPPTRPTPPRNKPVVSNKPVLSSKPVQSDKRTPPPKEATPPARPAPPVRRQSSGSKTVPPRPPRPRLDSKETDV